MGWGQQCLFYTSLDSSKTFISRPQIPLASSSLISMGSAAVGCLLTLHYPGFSLSLQLLLLYFSHFPPPKCGYSPNIFVFSCPCANSPTSDMMRHILEAVAHTCLSKSWPVFTAASVKYSLENHFSSSNSAFPNPTHHLGPSAQIRCILASQVLSRASCVGII